jgi:hypothetical protein
MDMKRVWVVLQKNDEGFADDVDVVGVYTTPEKADKVLAKCQKLYEQFYYVVDVLFDVDLIEDGE